VATDVSSRLGRIREIAEPIAAERGLEVLDIELAGPIVRILLDSPDESRKVGIDDCQAVSQRVGDGLDAHEAVGSRYMLEVSSPGVNRPLKKAEHFRRVLGRKVRVRTRPAGAERRTWLGLLEGVDEAGIRIATESAEVESIAWSDIDKANLEFEFEQKAVGKGRNTKPAANKRR
jgi:ribosome maturation factor RimP